MDNRTNIRWCLAILCVCVLFHSACSQTVDYSRDNGSLYPKKPLLWTQFFAQVFQGQTYREIYSLHPYEFPPALTKVSIRWERKGSDLTNAYTGLYDFKNGTEFCFPGTIFFNRTDDPKYVQFRFDLVIPGPIPHIGTMYSSYPSQYLLSWYCPESELQGKQCKYGTRISLLTSQDSPDHLPWESIVKDICKNGSPPLSDHRWTWTWKGNECPLAAPSDRKRRSVEELALNGQSVWP